MVLPASYQLFAMVVVQEVRHAYHLIHQYFVGSSLPRLVEVEAVLGLPCPSYPVRPLG